MKAPLLRLVLIIGFAILLLMAGVASAGPRGAALAPRRAQAAQVQQAQQAREAQQARDAQSVREEAKAAPAGTPGGGAPQQRPGKLTPDERRALRRQIDDAAREVYRTNR